MNPKFYYFNTLPFHPQPGRLEALSGYISFLSRNNGILTLSEMAKLVFPEHKLNLLAKFNDYPLQAFGNLPELTLCPTTTFLTATFYHSLKKFRYTTHPNTAAKFFRASVNSHLAFCPHCLEQNPHYLLTWRFLALKGCITHSCYLVSDCTYCHTEIPLITDQINYGLCPSCGKELKGCHTRPLPETVYQECYTRTTDLEFLLTFNSCESQVNTTMSSLGKQLIRTRLERSETVSQTAKRLGIPQSEVFFIEGGRTSNGMASLRSYQTYVYSNGLSFSNLLNQRVP